MIAAPVLGQEVKVAATLLRVRRDGCKVWARIPQMNPTTGIVVGCRTLSNGRVEYWEDGTTYEPTEHLPAVLVAINLRWRHVFVLAEDLTAVAAAIETLPLWQGSDIERDNT